MSSDSSLIHASRNWSSVHELACAMQPAIFAGKHGPMHGLMIVIDVIPMNKWSS